MSTRTPVYGTTILSADGSDPLEIWATIIGQGPIDIENHQYLVADSKQAADLPATWPKGFSVMVLTTQGASDGGWGKANGMIFTVTDASSIAYQLYFSGTSIPSTWFRVGLRSGWSAWLLAAGTGLPTAMASGQITLIPPAGGGTVVGTVLLPSGRFTSAPRIQLTAVTGVPRNVSVSLNATATATQFQVALDRTDDAIGTSIQWTAVLGVDS